MNTNGVRQTTVLPPRIGDIVTFPGKWKGDEGVGRLATLQYIKQRREWIGDVVVFNDIEPGTKMAFEYRCLLFGSDSWTVPHCARMLMTGLMLALAIAHKGYTDKNAVEGNRSACRSLN